MKSEGRIELATALLGPVIAGAAPHWLLQKKSCTLWGKMTRHCPPPLPCNGMGEGQKPCNQPPLPLLPMTSKRSGPRTTRVGELALSLTTSPTHQLQYMGDWALYPAWGAH